MTNAEIFKQAREAADDAIVSQFGHSLAGNEREIAYWHQVFEAVATHLQKHVNGVY